MDARTTAQRLEERVAALESRNRVNALGAAVVGGAAVLLLLFGAAESKPPELRVSNLQLVDSAGITRARLGLGPDGQPSLEFLNAAGNAQLALALPNSGEPEIRLSHANGTEQLVLQLANGNLPWITFKNANGVEVVDLGLNSYDAPSLEMSSGDEQRHMDLRFDEHGGFGFYAYSPDYDTRVSLGMSPDRQPMLALLDPTERPLATLAVDGKAGHALFTIQDAKGETQFVAPARKRP